MKRVSLLVGAFLLVVVLAACDPQPDGACGHRGDVYAKHGTVLHCTMTRDGLRWVK